MNTLPPLQFRPLVRRAIWGGRRLATMLGKDLGEGADFAESWEVVDRGEDQSVVESGPLMGKTLGELVRDHRSALLGHTPFERFPLLFKFLDCNRNLSVQVHPDDAYAAGLNPPDLGKTEAWVVLHADPGSVIYAGLKAGFDRPALEREIRRGTTELCLHTLQPRAGDCIFIPAGTVHALGGGLVVAEIQQASDTTFRLYDWKRLGPDGRPRPLHIEQALDVIDFERGPVEPQVPQPTERPDVEQLVACDKFILDRWRFDSPRTVGDDGRFHILAVLEGSVSLAHGDAEWLLSTGGTILIPAARGGSLSLDPRQPAVMLDMFLGSGT